MHSFIPITALTTPLDKIYEGKDFFMPSLPLYYMYTRIVSECLKEELDESLFVRPFCIKNPTSSGKK